MVKELLQDFVRWLRDSLSPRYAWERDKTQKWLAIAVTVLLSVIVISVIALLAMGVNSLFAPDQVYVGTIQTLELQGSNYVVEIKSLVDEQAIVAFGLWPSNSEAWSNLKYPMYASKLKPYFNEKIKVKSKMFDLEQFKQGTAIKCSVKFGQASNIVLATEEDIMNARTQCVRGKVVKIGKPSNFNITEILVQTQSQEVAGAKVKTKVFIDSLQAYSLSVGKSYRFEKTHDADSYTWQVSEE